MRYSDRVLFVTETNGGYNPDTGNHDETTKTIVEKACNLSTVGVKRSVELFGNVDTSLIVAQLQRPHDNDFSYVEITGGRYKGKYQVKEYVPHRTRTVFYLEGVQ